ncbi:hypothetical protein [Sporosarcina sp. NCCP-2378]|uniref:hypothetical protein n=1 Tax=Sporosarcina sp. NCCP-2378 TaxID=2934651 RepID=UPI00223084C3|nr:hypothetical protein [Sporosarcina sp. NCCP-2378]
MLILSGELLIQHPFALMPSSHLIIHTFRVIIGHYKIVALPKKLDKEQGCLGNQTE